MIERGRPVASSKVRRSRGVVITQSTYLHDSPKSRQLHSDSQSQKSEREAREKLESLPCVEYRTSLSRTCSIELGFDRSVTEITRHDEVRDTSSDEDSSRKIVECSMTRSTLMSDEENDQRGSCEDTESHPQDC